MSHRKVKSRGRNLLQREYLPFQDDYVCYLDEKGLEQAEARISQEIDDVEQCLGNESELLLVLKHDLSFLLCQQGRWDEAEELDIQVLEFSKKSLGAEHPFTLN